jgi:long-chain fatty acid transport protein
MIIRRNISGILVAMLAIIPCARVLANGFRIADQDAFATSRGEAFVATADNASAIYFNPAGITQLAGNNVRAGLYGIYYDPTYTPPSSSSKSGETFHIQNNLAAVPQFFYACTPENLPLSFGLGIYSPYGGSIVWPDDTGFRTVATKGALTYERFNATIAMMLAPGLSLGCGVTADYANIDLEQGLRPSASPLVNFFRFKGDGWTASYDFGLLWKPIEQLSLGATYRGSSTFTMAGHTEFEQQPVIPETQRPAEADFEFPLNATFGISWRPTPKWNLEFDADYTDWTSFKTVTISQTPPLPFPIKTDVPVTLRWQPSWMYEFGATRYFDNGWHVSVGYVFNENSVPDAYYSPLAADLDRHFFSAGVGFKGKRLGFDLAYQFGYGPARTVSGSQPSSQPAFLTGERADGTYNYVSHAVMVTFGVRF